MINWPYVIVCLIYGTLWGLAGMSGAVFVLGKMPEAFEILKIVAVGVSAFVGGVFTYQQNPSGAWNKAPKVS